MPEPKEEKEFSEGNDIGTRTETFLGEFRMIIPALAAILGFQLMVAFQESFQQLPRFDQVAGFLALACNAAAFLLLLMPASYHRFTWEFEETEDFLRFSRRSIGSAFVFMPMTLALTLYVQAVMVFDSRAAAAAVGATALGLALVFWWGVPMQRAFQEGYLPHQEAHASARDPRGRRPGRAARGRGRKGRKDEAPVASRSK